MSVVVVLGLKSDGVNMPPTGKCLMIMVNGRSLGRKSADQPR
jgi:hypothetical protein